MYQVKDNGRSGYRFYDEAMPRTMVRSHSAG